MATERRPDWEVDVKDQKVRLNYRGRKKWECDASETGLWPIVTRILRTIRGVDQRTDEFQKIKQNLFSKEDFKKRALPKVFQDR